MQDIVIILKSNPHKIYALDDIPKYLDVLLILDEKITKAKIYRLLDRSPDYLTTAIRRLQEQKLILVQKNPKDERTLNIELTPRGRDVQNIILALYNAMGIKKQNRRERYGGAIIGAGMDQDNA
jgi:DNA-binding MarR family transcriptional regulator